MAVVVEVEVAALVEAEVSEVGIEVVGAAMVEVAREFGVEVVVEEVGVEAVLWLRRLQ